MGALGQWNRTGPLGPGTGHPNPSGLPSGQSVRDPREGTTPASPRHPAVAPHSAAPSPGCCRPATSTGLSEGGLCHRLVVSEGHDLSLVPESSAPNMEKQVQMLTRYLWSRKLPVEPGELRRRAAQLEEKLRQRIGPAPGSAQAEEKLQGAVLSALRQVTYHWKELSYDEGLSLVYMAARLDGTFAATSRAFHEIQKRLPDFQPRTLLDFGSGPGSVSWAAHSTWGQSLREYLCVDRSAAMLALAERLLKGGSDSGESRIPAVFLRQFLPVSPKVQFDIVVAAFSLSELPSLAARSEVVSTLWRKTGRFLVLVESGTKAGHQLIMAARDLVLQGQEKTPLDPRPGHVFAPCPHDLACPHLSASRTLPCNFSQTYYPTPFGWQDRGHGEEKFSLVILSRDPPPGGQRWSRVIQPVLKRPRHVHCHLCCPDGHLEHMVFTARRHGRDLYRCARASAWGDLLPVTTAPPPPKDPPR
ncbi:methyltransferase-like protein 17, mitochondrial isoform X1 [Ornithorhynchus anatinus]|uniref:methyltransferase-like protein 17, mitochondrial isoform X1 n=2 Tax=Ornithorhynchus anatinus TaxID=9258 RepID=UPI0019D43148|nr:methyltransferase-like protein 17, mitochondrial isoform X1 [Ornithorhynchus anatinus]